jgi:uncharacterized Zn-binding protein involved in type VI secretion
MAEEMGQPAAKKGDEVVGTDTHLVVPPAGPPVALPYPFAGTIDGGLSPDVRIMGQPAARVGCTATNDSPHDPMRPGTGGPVPTAVPAPPGAAFQRPPRNSATVKGGSATVRINGKPAVRHGDIALTCNDPADLPAGTVRASGTVRIG